MKTKTEYVKVEFANDKELAKAFSEMDLYVQNPLTTYDELKSFNRLNTINETHKYWIMRTDLYKKVEVKVDVKKEAREYMQYCTALEYHNDFDDFYDSALSDLGEREFIGACHLIAELTDDPRSE
jgi:hypothetical protein